jgi:hypothetical protein
MLQDWRTFGRAAKWEGEGTREFDGGLMFVVTVISGIYWRSAVNSPVRFDGSSDLFDISPDGRFGGGHDGTAS